MDSNPIITGVWSVQQLMTAVFSPQEKKINRNQLIRVDGIIGYRDSLTEFQQKILTAALALVHGEASPDQARTAYAMNLNNFIHKCGISQAEGAVYLAKELEKIAQKGLWLWADKTQRLTRTPWFQAIEYTDREIVFQFTEKVRALVVTLAPEDIEYQLARGIQYKGKHTMAIFEIIWAGRAGGVIEYSIPELMQELSLEHTRYSYGQLKLRVLEPSLQEIYDWDDQIFVRFGPTFNGRRVEGVWFQVITGEKAGEMRQQEPEFKFALPEQKPDKGNFLDCK